MDGPSWLLVLVVARLQGAETTVQLVQTLHVLVKALSSGSGGDSQGLLHLMARSPGEGVTAGGVVGVIEGVHQFLEVGIVGAKLVVILAEFVQGHRCRVLLIRVPKCLSRAARNSAKVVKRIS